MQTSPRQDRQPGSAEQIPDAAVQPEPAGLFRGGLPLPRWFPLIGLGVAALLLTFATVPSARVPTEAEPDTIADASWCAVLEFAHQHRLQFGTDIVFTYGPLGFLATPYTFCTAAGSKFLAAIALSFVGALSMSLLARRLGKFQGMILVCVYLFLAGNIFPRSDLLLELSLLAWGILCIVERGPTLIICVLILCGIAVFAALVKFTLLIMAVLTVGVISLDLFLRNHRTLGLAALMAVILGFITMWVGIGQNLIHLGTFLRRELITSAGYNGAMGFEGSGLLRDRAILTLLFAVATIVSTVIARAKKSFFPESDLPSIRSAEFHSAVPQSSTLQKDSSPVPSPLEEEGATNRSASGAGTAEMPRCEVPGGLSTARQLLLAGWLLGMLFLVWKHGFVRSDRYHAGFFFGFAPLLALLWASLASWNWQRHPTASASKPAATPQHASGRGPSGLLALRTKVAFLPPIFAIGCVLVSLFTVQTMLLPGDWQSSLAQPFSTLGTTISDLVRPATFRERAQAAVEAERRRNQLPLFRSLIGRSSVDMFGWEQTAMLANELDYRPRPVFQTYAAYSAPLMQWNETFYQSAAAPEFVMFRLGTMDRKLPSMQDSLLLRHLLINYELVAREGPFLLLKSNRNERAELKLVQQTFVRPGEPLELSKFGSANLWLEMDLKPTLLGRLRQVFYQSPTTRLVVSAIVSGKSVDRRFRAPAPMLAAGFLINPLMLEQQDVQALYNGAESNRPKRCALEVNRGDEKFWQPTIPVRIYQLENLLGRDGSNLITARFLNPTPASPVPSLVSGNAHQL